MTEAELRRLAEIMTELAPEPSGSGFWQIMSAVAVGVLIGVLGDLAKRLLSRIEAWVAAFRDRRATLHKVLMELASMGDSIGETNEAYLKITQMHVRSALDDYGDLSYKRRLERVLSASHEPLKGMRMRMELDEVIEDLELRGRPIWVRASQSLTRLLERYSKQREP